MRLLDERSDRSLVHIGGSVLSDLKLGYLLVELGFRRRDICLGVGREDIGQWLVDTLVRLQAEVPSYTYSAFTQGVSLSGSSRRLAA